MCDLAQLSVGQILRPPAGCTDRPAFIYHQGIPIHIYLPIWGKFHEIEFDFRNRFRSLDIVFLGGPYDSGHIDDLIVGLPNNGYHWVLMIRN